MTNSKFSAFIALFAFTYLATIIAEPLAAQENTAPAEEDFSIQFIEVEGSQRVEADTVRSYMILKPGMTADPVSLDQSLKSMFASGLFADVTIRRERGGLIVTVVENPIVNRVIFEGNDKLDDDDLYEESSLRPRQVYTRSKIQNDVEKFVELYRRSGRFSAKVEPKVIQLPQNRVDVVFEIEEGETTRVRSINFIGNKRFDDDRLREEISTQESRWWRFLSSNDKYDPDRIAYDSDLLRRFYLSKGYADFRVISSFAELTRDGKKFFVTFNVEEGEKYEFGESVIDTKLKDVNIQELEQLIRHATGRVYNSKKVDDTVDDLTEALGAKGYAFADVRPRVRRNRKDLIVNITYRIEEGPRVYVERINVNNNVRTQDRVIRREMYLREGDAFNRALLNKSERNIKALNFFGEVEITETPGDDEDSVVLDIDVEEQSTGELAFGIGYSSVEDLSTQFSIVERNLLGRGQLLSLSTSISSQRTFLNLRFAEPYFLNRDLFGSVDVFRTTTDYDTEAALETSETGLGGSIGFPVAEDARLNIFVRLSENELINDAYTPQFGAYLRPFTELKAQLGYTYTIDKRDDVIDPTEGWDFIFSQNIATPLGDVTYIRSTIVADYYKPFFEEWVFHAKLSGGIIGDYEKEGISYNDNFFVGGSIIRGFKRSGVGPRDLQTDYVLGAKQYLVGTLEAKVPLGIPKDFGIKTYIFTDFGVIGKTDVEATNVRDDSAFRASYGLTFNWKSPFGPVRFDLARPLAEEEYDRAQFFRFTAGTRF